MRRVLRAVVLWLFALAIPVQGMAAVAMSLCPPAHHDVVSAAVADHAAHHAGGDAAAAHHVAATAAPADAADAGHPVLKCCSAVAAIASVLPPSLTPYAPTRSPAPLQPKAQLHAGVTPDGLDRPPKPAA